MQQPWSAEIIVEPELAQKLIQSQFPDLAPVLLQLLGQGFDNTVYKVNNSYVFRFPRRQLAVDLLLNTGMHLLPKLAPLLPLPIPTPVLFGTPSTIFKWPFAGYRLLPGQTGCYARLDEQERTAIAAPLAQFLRALHAISADQAKQMGAGSDTLERADVPRRWANTVENVTKIQELGLIAPAIGEKLITVLHSLKEVQSKGPTTLVHGDMYARHLLINDQRMLCGIIDWDDVHIGDPAVDLQIMFSFLPPQAHKIFVQHYGKIDTNTHSLALFRAIFHSSTIVVYSHDVGDQDLLDEGLQGLQFITQSY